MMMSVSWIIELARAPNCMGFTVHTSRWHLVASAARTTNHRPAIIALTFSFTTGMTPYASSSWNVLRALTYCPRLARLSNVSNTCAHVCTHNSRYRVRTRGKGGPVASQTDHHHMRVSDC